MCLCACINFDVLSSTRNKKQLLPNHQLCQNTNNPLNECNNLRGNVKQTKIKVERMYWKEDEDKDEKQMDEDVLLLPLGKEKLPIIPYNDNSSPRQKQLFFLHFFASYLHFSLNHIFSHLFWPVWLFITHQFNTSIPS